MQVPDFLKPNSRMVPPGQDPLAPPHRTRKKTPAWLLVLSILGMIAFCGVGAWGLIRNATGANAESPTQTATEYGAGTITVFNPAVSVYTATPEATRTLITGAGLLTQYAGSQTPESSPTITPSPTLCTGDHFLTQLVCDDLNMTATIEAAQVGEVINVSGVDPKVTTVYVYPTPYPSPWIVTASPTWTPVVITATPQASQTPWFVYQVVTATPGATQTPWFFITQPPVVTVMWTQLVTVVVTATPTVTPIPSDTPTPTEIPTETPTP